MPKTKSKRKMKVIDDDTYEMDGLRIVVTRHFRENGEPVCDKLVRLMKRDAEGHVRQQFNSFKK